MLHKSNHGATLSLLYYQDKDCTYYQHTKDRPTAHYSKQNFFDGDYVVQVQPCRWE